MEGAVTAILKARLGLFDARVFALVEVNAQEAAAVLGRLNHCVGILDGSGGGFGHDHIQAGFERIHGRRAVQVVRSIDLDGVELDLGQEFPVVGEASAGGHTGKVGKPVAALLVRVCDGADFQEMGVMAAEVKVLVNLAHHGPGADDAKLEFSLHIWVHLCPSVVKLNP